METSPKILSRTYSLKELSNDHRFKQCEMLIDKKTQLEWKETHSMDNGQKLSSGTTKPHLFSFFHLFSGRDISREILLSQGLAAALG